MKAQTALSAALLLVGAAHFAMAGQEDAMTIRQAWSDWKAQHNKQYETPEEDARRYAVFVDNKKLVDEHNDKFNKGEVSYSVGLNPFSDLTSEEFRLRNGHGLKTKDAALQQEWSDWKATHNKQYESAAEERLRYAVFLDNKKFVEEHNEKFNKGEVSYSVGLNAHSDLTPEEMRQRNGLRLRPKRDVDAVVIREWSEWKATHNKQYESPEEEARRFTVFQDNKKFVDEHNAKFNKGEVSYSVGLNHFSDLTPEEMKKHTGFRAPQKQKRAVLNADAIMIRDWAEWKATHNKQYESPEEEARRFAVFQDNKKRIEEHNQKFSKGEVTYSMGLNAFSDLTTEEFKQRNGHGIHKKEEDVATKALKQAWTEWKTEHNRQYETPAEEARRFALFQETKQRVDEHNEKFKRGEVTFSMGLNSFSDMTPEEVKQRFGRGVLPRKDH